MKEKEEARRDEPSESVEAASKEESEPVKPDPNGETEAGDAPKTKGEPVEAAPKEPPPPRMSRIRIRIEGIAPPKGTGRSGRSKKKK